MVLLELLGVALGAATISSATKQSSKKANPRLNESQFDADCARYSVIGQDIMDVAARCGVKPNKYGVLPEDGYKHCMKYVTQYVNHPDDIELFKRDWLLAVEQQLKAKSDLMIRKHWDNYQHQYQGYLNNKDHWLGGPEIVLEYKHWHGLPKDQYLQRLEDIQTKTFWGELTIQPPILRNNPRFEDSFIEVWVMQGRKGHKQGSWLTNKLWESTYKDCCGVCGYDAML